MPTTVKHCFKGVSLIIELDNKYKYYKIQIILIVVALIIYLETMEYTISF